MVPSHQLKCCLKKLHFGLGCLIYLPLSFMCEKMHGSAVGKFDGPESLKRLKQKRMGSVGENIFG
jgi:hypothetical protein